MGVRSKVWKCIAGLLSVILIITSMATSIVQCLADNSVTYNYNDENVSVEVIAPNKGVIPDGAKLSVTAVNITDDMKTTISDCDDTDLNEADAVYAYDIKFIQTDGTQVEPTQNVQVLIKQQGIDFGSESMVYHYDDKAETAQAMDTSVTNDGKVKFGTDHFSTYLAASFASSDKCTVTVEFCDTSGNHLYSDASVVVNYKEKIKLSKYVPDYIDLNQWNISSCKKIGYLWDTTVGYNEENKIKSNTTFVVYLSGKTETVSGDTTFYDYLVKPYTGNQYNPRQYGEYIEYPELSINTGSNYSDSNSAANRKRLSVGTGAGEGWAQNYRENLYYAYVSNGMDANKFNYHNVTPNIVKGLSDDYTNVIFNLDEPGLFSSESKTGKSILNGYHLNFSKSGVTYTLDTVSDPNNSVVASKGDNFFPLDNAPTNTADGGYNSNHNYYFGMRYDVAFTLGNYMGPLDYSFSGDDDLWVLLDGAVVLDIGGIHDAVKNSVNLRDYLGTDADSDTVHHLTVLYMERGANASNCTMSFTIPNATVEETQVGQLQFAKTDESGNALSGADFTLTNDSNSSEIYTETSNASGRVIFDNLAAGTYTLEEKNAPSGYKLLNQKYKVVVTNNKKAQSADVKLYKADAEGKADTSEVITSIANKKDGSDVPTYSNIEQSKTAVVTDWDNRTYKLDLYASHNLKVSTPVNLVMAFDISGSMPWFVSQPTGGTTTRDTLTAADRTSQTLATGGLTGVGAWNYKYYVLRKSEGEAYEYKPIGYDSNSNKWKFIISSSDGSKKFSSGSDVTVSSSETIYIRGNGDQTKLEALATSITNFTDNMKEVSPDSQVGFVFFASDVKKEIGLQSIQNIDISSILNSIQLYGGTNQKVALEDAQNIVNTAKNKYSKNILLFSDGQPNSEVSINDITAAASDIKNSGITIYTAGLFRDTNNAGCQGLINWASQDCAFVADSATGLSNSFSNVFAAINVKLSGVTIRDYIDNRFELIDNDGNVLTQGAVFNDGVVGNDENGWYVEWNNQTLGYATDTTKGWHEFVRIRAKSEYIGGNVITTNGPTSGITVDDHTKLFDQPVVNVKTTLNIQDVNQVIFYGDSAAKASEVIDDILVNTYTMGKDGNVLNPADFTITWYSNEACTDVVNPADITVNADGSYYVKVTYQVGTSTQISKINSNGNEADGTAFNQTTDKDYAVYSIKVVKGQIDLGKIIDKQYTDVKAIHANQTFIFKIQQYEVKENKEQGNLVATFYETIAFDANGKVTEGNATISGLKKGYYTVTEETNWSKKYKLKSTTDNYVKNTTDGVALLIGEKTSEATADNKCGFYGLEQKDSYLAVADGEAASITFINKKDSNWKWVSDVASAINKFLQ